MNGARPSIYIKLPHCGRVKHQSLSPLSFTFPLRPTSPYTSRLLPKVGCIQSTAHLARSRFSTCPGLADVQPRQSACSESSADWTVFTLPASPGQMLLEFHLVSVSADCYAFAAANGRLLLWSVRCRCRAAFGVLRASGDDSVLELENDLRLVVTCRMYGVAIRARTLSAVLDSNCKGYPPCLASIRILLGHGASIRVSQHYLPRTIQVFSS